MKYGEVNAARSYTHDALGVSGQHFRTMRFRDPFAWGRGGDGGACEQAFPGRLSYFRHTHMGLGTPSSRRHAMRV
jgi:hypothetical protein